MKLSEICTILEAECLAHENALDTEVTVACGSDLMSDVLAFGRSRGVLLTGLVNPQVIRTAEMMDITAIVFVRGKMPTDEVIELAKKKDIVILRTERPLYMACGLLYSNGLRGKKKHDQATL